MGAGAPGPKVNAFKEGARRMFCGVPLADMRRSYAKRSKRPVKKTVAVRSLSAGLAVLLGLVTALTAVQIKLVPGNPGWYAILWVYAGALVMLVGYAFNLLPESGTSRILMLASYVIGVLAIPFTVALFVVDFNIVVLIVAALFAVPFIVMMNHYGRRVTLYREGYAV